MTVHDRFTRTKRLVFSALLIPWSMALILGLVGPPDQKGLRTTIVMIAMLVFMAGLACVYAFAFRCPRCRKSLAIISNRGGSEFPQDVRYCPYCGLDLEVETDAVRNAYQSMERTAARRGFTLCVARTSSVRSTCALGGGRSSLFR